MEKNHPKNKTPYLHNNLKNLLGNNINWNKKIDINDYKELKEIDLTDSIFKNYKNLICATAICISDRELKLNIYRYDENDYINEKKPINVDEYILEQELQKRNDFNVLLNSTEYNENMKQTFNGFDFSVKVKVQEIKNHHDFDLPLDVIKILKNYKPNYEKLIRDGIVKKITENNIKL